MTLQRAERGELLVNASWEELARAAGTGDPGPQEPEVLRELLTFLLDGTAYAIPVERVREIVRLRPITPMPRVPAQVLGVIALRGEIVQVVDLRMGLGVAAAELTRASRIIVLHGDSEQPTGLPHGDDEQLTGVLVDEVQEVLRITEAEIDPAPGGEGLSVAGLCARGSEFVSILDTQKVLDFGADG